MNLEKELNNLPIGTRIEKHLTLNVATGHERITWQIGIYEKEALIMDDDLIEAVKKFKKLFQKP